MIDARFGHVNVIARDWRRLAGFYTRVFGCTFVPPERDYRGPDLSAGTGVPNAVLRGVHLRLPGLGPDGPTIEIYEYEPSLDALPTAANRPGFGHIAFVVPDVRCGSAPRACGGRYYGRRGRDASNGGRQAGHMDLRHRSRRKHPRIAELVRRVT